MENRSSLPGSGGNSPSDQSFGGCIDETQIQLDELFGDTVVQNLDELDQTAGLIDFAGEDASLDALPTLENAEKTDAPAATEPDSIDHNVVRPDAKATEHHIDDLKSGIHESESGRSDPGKSEAGEPKSNEPSTGSPDSCDNRADSVHEDESPREAVEDAIDPTHVDDSFCRRQTRQHAGSKRGLTSWIDNDKSGDFDPNRTEQHARRKRLRTTCLKPRIPTQASRPQQPGPQLLVCLNVGAVALLDVKPPIEAPKPASGYNLRDREKSPVSDIKEDVSWRPQARGCKACFNLKLEDCSLVKDEYHWPCPACDLLEEFCELIVPPVRRQPCDDCKRRKIKCSYGYTRNHIAPCQQCVAANIKCQAGPAKEFIRRRIRYPKAGEDLPPPPVSEKRKGKHRAPEPCRECVQTETQCEYESDEPSGCCRVCKSTGLPCTAQDAPTEPPARNKANTPSPAESVVALVSNQPLVAHHPLEELPTVSRVEEVPYVMKHINTAFYHPIIANCDIIGSKSQLCSFCSDPTMHFIGAGPRTIQVYDYHDYRPFVENKNDPATSGPTALCVICTSKMLDIYGCQKHVKKAILGANPKESDHLKAFRAIFSEEYKGSAEHCSLCLRLASFQCSIPTIDVRGKPQLGCGLKLCIKCASRLEGLYDGSVQDMLAAKDDDDENELYGRRADTEFLRKDGVLARHVAQLCGQYKSGR